MKSILSLVLSGAVLMGAPPKPCFASETVTLPIDAAQWRTLKIPGARENQFSIRGDALQVVSDGSVSFRYLELPETLNDPTELSWIWRVDQHPPLVFQSQKGRDDRPLAVHIWFDTQGRASLFGNLASMAGRPKIGHLLTYVWGAMEPSETVLANPYYDKGRVIVVVGKNGRTGEWREVRRNIVDDYRRAFGKTPDMSTLRYVAISADTDDLSGRSAAAVRSLAFKAP